jgi:hypothetical protein
VILDNLSANTTPQIRAWAKRNKVELCLTPTYTSWANPIEAQFGPLRTFTMSNSNHPNHTVLTRAIQAYLRWRNANARHPAVGTAARIGDRFGQAACVAGVVMMVSYSMGVNRPSEACRRRRW